MWLQKRFIILSIPVGPAQFCHMPFFPYSLILLTKAKKTTWTLFKLLLLALISIKKQIFHDRKKIGKKNL